MTGLYLSGDQHVSHDSADDTFTPEEVRMFLMVLELLGQDVQIRLPQWLIFKMLVLLH